MGEDDLVARCQQCHPLARQQLRQQRKCPGCHMTVFVWDCAPCGSHSSPVPTRDRRPDRDRIKAIVGAYTAPVTQNGHRPTLGGSDLRLKDP